MVGCWWQPTTIVQCQSLVSLAATIVDKRVGGAAMNAYKQRPTLEQQSERRTERKRECELRERESCTGSSLAAIAAAATAVCESWEQSRVDVILLLHIYCNPFSIYLNNIDSPVDVGGFAEPR